MLVYYINYHLLVYAIFSTCLVYFPNFMSLTLTCKQGAWWVAVQKGEVQFPGGWLARGGPLSPSCTVSVERIRGWRQTRSTDENIFKKEDEEGPVRSLTAWWLSEDNGLHRGSALYSDCSSLKRNRSSPQEQSWGLGGNNKGYNKILLHNLLLKCPLIFKGCSTVCVGCSTTHLNYN